MKKYKVKITETLTKSLEVEANCPIDARDIAEQMWRDGIIFLGANDFEGVRFLVKSEGESK